MKNKLKILFINLLLIGLTTAQNTGKKLYEFVTENDNMVLHGFGQGLYRWQTDAVPYFEAINNKPVAYSSYLTLTDIRIGELPRLEQFRFFNNGWTDSTASINYSFIPIIGVSTAGIDFDLRQDTLSHEFFKELGITEELQSQYNINNPTYSLSVFQNFLNAPDLWEIVKDTLTSKGFEVNHINLEEIFESSSDEEIYELIKIRDSVVVLANENLLDKGFLFGDLEILNGNFDDEISQLADSLKAVDSPILVRLLFETISGFSRSYIFSRTTYQQAHWHFVDILRSRGADNVEFIFHANNSNTLSLEEWYPGDEYVDWTATSIFHPIEDNEGLERESQFALEHDKPFMIVESSPTEGKYRPNNIDRPDVWAEWFIPYFDFIKSDANTKLFVYIGIDWGVLTGNFNDWGNTRVQENPELFQKYDEELSNEIYLHNLDFWEIFNDSLLTNVNSVNELPEDFKLFQNYPNPFNPTTTIKFTIPYPSLTPVESVSEGRVRAVLTIYDALGRKITTLVNEEKLPGTYEVKFDASGLSSGVYFYQLNLEGKSDIKKMILLR